MAWVGNNGLHSAAARFGGLAALSALLLATGTASAASLKGPISGWQQGTEPSNMSMYIYVPDNVKANAPILVALHYCGGNASNVFSLAQSGGVVSAADQNGFIILVPQTSRNCWDVATTPSLTHDGGSDTKSIVHQVAYTVTQYKGNADRVYVMGTSGGAMGAEGLAAVYPDVFKGAVEFSGVPAGCWAVGNMTDGQWSSACAGGMVTHTEQEWGDMVRAMYPGYSGFRPRIQLWHGDADSTINFKNHTEAIKQWRNVLGLPADPTATSSVTVNGKTFNRQEWKDACGTTVLDVMTEPGGPHNTSANMTGQYSVSFLKLDVAGDKDPEAASTCGTASGGMGGMGGSGMGGSGTSGSGSGMGGASGMPASGGAPATGGMAATAGMTASGGMGGTGNQGMGGTANPGGGAGVPMGGSAPMSSGGTSPMGAGGTGAPPATGGTGMSTATGGTGTAGTGSPGTGGSGTAPTAKGEPPAEAGGCAFNAGNAPRTVNALALAGLFVAMFARRRSRPVS